MTDGQATVLLVDDEPNIISALSRTLRQEPYRVLATADPAQVLDLVGRERVDVLVSDIQMPAVSGLDLVARVRAAFPHVVRILLTGNGSLEAALEAINAGEVYRFLTKPWDADGLRATVRQAVQRAADLKGLSATQEIADRRTRLLAELEREHPGISRLPPQGGAHELDEARLRNEVATLLPTAIAAMIG